MKLMHIFPLLRSCLNVSDKQKSKKERELEAKLSRIKKQTVHDRLTVPKNADASINDDTHAYVHVDVNKDNDKDARVNADDFSDVSNDVKENVSVPKNNDGNGYKYIDANVDSNSDANKSVYGDKNKNETISVNVDNDLNVLVSENINIKTLNKQMKGRKGKETFEDLHKRRTVWIRNDLNKILDLELENGGNLTKTINNALTLYYNVKSRGMLHDE